MASSLARAYRHCASQARRCVDETPREDEDAAPSLLFSAHSQSQASVSALCSRNELSTTRCLENVSTSFLPSPKVATLDLFFPDKVVLVCAFLLRALAALTGLISSASRSAFDSPRRFPAVFSTLARRGPDETQGSPSQGRRAERAKGRVYLSSSSHTAHHFAIKLVSALRSLSPAHGSQPQEHPH